MEKLYKVELKGIGTITANAEAFDNLMSALYQAMNYSKAMAKKATEAKLDYCASLYKKDENNYIEASQAIVEILLEERAKYYD